MECLLVEATTTTEPSKQALPHLSVMASWARREQLGGGGTSQHKNRMYHFIKTSVIFPTLLTRVSLMKEFYSLLYPIVWSCYPFFGPSLWRSDLNKYAEWWCAYAPLYSCCHVICVFVYAAFDPSGSGEVYGRSESSTKQFCLADPVVYNADWKKVSGGCQGVSWEAQTATLAEEIRW